MEAKLGNFESHLIMVDTKEGADFLARQYRDFLLTHKDDIRKLTAKFPPPQDQPPQDYLLPAGACFTDASGVAHYPPPEYSRFYPYSRRGYWITQSYHLPGCNRNFTGWLVDNLHLLDFRFRRVSKL